MGRLWRIILFCLVISLAVLPQRASTAKEWKHYTNRRWNFCINVPSGWSWDEGFNGAGIFSGPPSNGPLDNRSGVEIGARYDQPSQKSPGHMQTLDEIFSSRPDVIGKIQNVKLVSKRTIVIQNNPAIYARTSYQLNDEAWTAETITFLTTHGIVFLIEMRCRQSQFEPFDRIFRAMAFRSFRLNCH